MAWAANHVSEVASDLTHQNINNRNNLLNKTVELAVNTLSRGNPNSLMKYLKKQLAMNMNDENYQFQLLQDLGWSSVFSNPPYAIYDGTIYYFETQKANHVHARINCARKFNGQGRLFQPRTAHTNNIILFLANGVTGGGHQWIGVDRIGRSSNGTSGFYYEGTTTNPFFISFDSLSSKMNESGDCVLTWKSGHLIEWQAQPCTAGHYSICEKKKNN